MKTIENLKRALQSTQIIIEAQQRSVFREDGIHPTEIKMSLEDSATIFYNLMSVRDQVEAALQNLEKL